MKTNVGIMYHILKREKFNLSVHMLRIMQEAILRAKPTLPYGMFLTLVFHDFGVGVLGELCKMLQHYNTYNEKSMKRMGFLKVEG